MERSRALIAARLLCACGGTEAEVFEDDDEGQLESELGVASPSDRVIVWQQNVEAMKAAAVRPSLLTTAMLAYTYKPDIVLMQEAWQRVLCNNYLDAAAA